MTNEELGEMLGDLTPIIYNSPPGMQGAMQQAFGDATKKAMVWLPGGREGQPAPARSTNITAAKFLGLGQGFYPLGTEHQHVCDNFWLCWTGIDIDLDEGRSVHSVGKAIHRALPWVGVRTSASGKGIHVINLITPIKVPVSKRTHYVKAINKPLVEKILNTGHVLKHEVCKWDYRIFWLGGGANEWHFKPGQPLTVTAEQVARTITDSGAWGRNTSVGATSVPESNPHLTGILDRLRGEGLELKPGRTQVNVCYAHRALQDTQWSFTTRSGNPTQSDPRSRTNGFVEYIPGRRITIFANADGRVVREFCTPEEMRSRIGA